MTTSGGAVDPLDQRIGDAERSSALDVLGEHFAAGRLDLAEYESRSAQVTTSRTQRDLTGLFTDLPGVVPVGQAPLAVRPDMTSPAVPAPVIVPAPTSERRNQIASAIGGLTALLCVIVYFSVRGSWDQAWLVFLAVPVAGLVAQLMVRDRPTGR